MNAIEFVNRYDQYLDEIRSVIRPELFPQLEELAQIDPHDLVNPETWFPDENSAKGFVWLIFVRRVKEHQLRLNRQ
ncbi:MAG: hypothetical protein WCO44_17725 [Bacteroidota bacterium]